MKATCKALGMLARPCRRALAASFFVPFRKSGFAILGAAAFTAASALFSVSVHAATVFIQVTQNDSGHALCNVFCTQIVSSGAATQDPVQFSNAGKFISASGEVGSSTLKIQSSTNTAGGISVGMSDTFTVQGTGSGPVSLTAVLHATGSVSSVQVGSIHELLGATVITVGTLGSTNLPSGTLYSVFPFGGPSDPNSSKVTDPSFVFAGAPFSFSSDMTATYTFLAAIGSTFDLAIGLKSGFTVGATDFSHTATLSFNTPSGVYLTSSLGGMFGDAPAAAAVPVPTALPLFASGLGVLAWAARRKKRTAAAA